MEEKETQVNTEEITKPAENTEVKNEVASNPNKEYEQLKVKMEELINSEKKEVDKKSEEQIPDENQQSEEAEAETSNEEVEIPSNEPSVDPNLYDLAVELGFSEDEIKGMSSAGVLGKTITRIIKANQNIQPEEKSAPESNVDNGEYKINLNKEEVDNSIVEEFEKMAKHFNDKIKELSKVNTQLREKDIQNERASFVDWFDKEVDALGDYKHIFGTSQEARNKANSTAQKNRTLLLKEMNCLNTGYVDNGVKIGREELLQRALRSAFGNEVNKVATNNVIKKKENFKKMTANMPFSKKEQQSPDDVILDAYRNLKVK